MSNELPDSIRDVVRAEIGNDAIFDLLVADEVGAYYSHMMAAKEICEEIITEFTGSYTNSNDPTKEIARNLKLFEEGEIDELSNRLASIARSLHKGSIGGAEEIITRSYTSMQNVFAAKKIVKYASIRHNIAYVSGETTNEDHLSRGIMWRSDSFSFDIFQRLCGILYPNPFFPPDPRDVDEN